MKRVILRPGRQKSVLQHHPWIFSGAIERVTGSPEPGETVEVRANSGEFLAWGAFSPTSQIRVRLWSWDAEEQINAGFFHQRLQASLERRRLMVSSEETNAYRLVHAESDGLPGLVVDRYGDTLVIQILAAGAEAWREVITDSLFELSGARSIYERSDVDVRRLEGLDERVGLLRGEAPPQRIEIHEHNLRFWTGIERGHKTGFYLDQRANRLKLRSYSADREALNCFAYTASFAVNSLEGGARSVLSIDTSAEALDLGREHVTLNGFSAERAAWLEGDVFQALRTLRDQARSYDLIVLDPPKFAPTTAQAERAARGYKDINLLAFKLLRPGGVLFTFSCSGGVSIDLFQKIVAGAALDAGVEARIVERLSQAPDHPVALNFPEGSYLKGLVCTL